MPRDSCLKHGMEQNHSHGQGPRAAQKRMIRSMNVMKRRWSKTRIWNLETGGTCISASVLCNASTLDTRSISHDHLQMPMRTASRHARILHRCAVHHVSYGVSYHASSEHNCCFIPRFIPFQVIKSAFHTVSYPNAMLSLVVDMG